MSDVASAFDPIKYVEAFPSLKYALAVGIVVMTLYWVNESWKKVRNGLGPSRPDDDGTAIARMGRIERKLNRLMWETRETRQDLRDLMDVVRPGAHRRPLTEYGDDSDGG